jgi:hypothetical protein
MDTIQDHINIVFGNSFNSQDHFKNKHQNEIDRFVFCGIEKVSKISLTFLRLYPQINTTPELEFSLGILARSLLMDMILVMGAKKIIHKLSESSLPEVKEELREYCYKVISDGTNFIIDEIFDNEKISDEEKNRKSVVFVSIFPKAFDTSSGKPKRKKDFRYTLNDIYRNNRNPNLRSGESIYNLYNYYSKYDHLSHWTSLSQKIPFDKRKSKLDLAIILMVFHVRDLLAIAYDMNDEFKIIEPYIVNLQTFLEEKYKSDSSHFKTDGQ